MLIWAWIFAVPFVAAAIDLALTGRASTAGGSVSTRPTPLGGRAVAR